MNTATQMSPAQSSIDTMILMHGESLRKLQEIKNIAQALNYTREELWEADPAIVERYRTKITRYKEEFDALIPKLDDIKSMNVVKDMFFLNNYFEERKELIYTD